MMESCSTRLQHLSTTHSDTVLSVCYLAAMLAD